MSAVPLILSVAGTAMSVIGKVQQANAQAKAANYQAAQAEQAASQQRAASQRAAGEQLRQARIAQSNALAAAGASGAGVGVTEGKIISDIAGEGQYRAMTSLFDGDQQARNYENQAAALRYEGRTARQSGYMDAIGSGIVGGNSLYTKYWPGSSGLENPMSSGWKSTKYSGSNITWN